MARMPSIWPQLLCFLYAVMPLLLLVYYMLKVQNDASTATRGAPPPPPSGEKIMVGTSQMMMSKPRARDYVERISQRARKRKEVPSKGLRDDFYTCLSDVDHTQFFNVVVVLYCNVTWPRMILRPTTILQLRLTMLCARFTLLLHQVGYTFARSIMPVPGRPCLY
ncbi:hypothetical protein B296_00056626 [Ensete ventricosum]|uniref:Uncharacterized protein n=1 Tax=Ensete ventricosum TaxID=4639 RepID=A0A426X9K4_ENSVE|nr:hypothetical protein B296_00056626 [Ensete ventricosum]